MIPNCTLDGGNKPCECKKDDCDFCGPASDFFDGPPLFVSEEALLYVELHSDEFRRKSRAEREW